MARHCYENGRESDQDIAGMLGLTPEGLKALAAREGWGPRGREAALGDRQRERGAKIAAEGDPPPRDPAELARLGERIRGLLAAQLDVMDERLKAQGKPDTVRAASTAAIVARCYREVATIEAQLSRLAEAAHAPPITRSPEELREELARRLDEMLRRDGVEPAQ